MKIKNQFILQLKLSTDFIYRFDRASIDLLLIF